MTERHFHFAHVLLPDGWARDVRLSVRDGLVAGIHAPVAALADDQRHAIALPGLPNLHSHAFQRGMAGLAEMRGATADSFWTWREVMYRFVERVTPEDLRDLAALAYVEMLESGFTRVGEFHYLHHDVDGSGFADRAATSAAIAAAAEESGIALTLLPVFYAHGGFGAQPLGGAQRRFASDLDGFVRLLDAVRGVARGLPDAVAGVAPHSLRAATLDQIVALAGLAGDAPVHVHVAEQAREVADCLAWSGARPVDLLLREAPVDRRWCLVHATHMTDAEARAMAATGAVAGLCPVTEANLGDGLFAMRPYRAAGGAYGIGSDSNVLIDATEELRLLEYGQRLARQARNILAEGGGGSTGDAVYRAALAGGARALGARPGLAAGHPADFVTLDAGHPSLIGRTGPALIDALVFAAGRSAIDGVWRRGERLVSNGRHRAREAIHARYRRTLARLLA